MSGACPNKMTISLKNGGSVVVHCRTCDLCRQTAMTSMVGRCLLEEESSVATSCLTLTYADDGDHGASEVIHKEQRGYADVQRMFKRLRKAGYVFRYLAAMETGDQYGRLHFHVLLFWINKRPNLPDIDVFKQMWRFWPHGFTYNGAVNTQAIGYVVKYMLKEQTLEEKGKPKKSGQKRSSGYRDKAAIARERFNRLDVARSAGFDSWNDFAESVEGRPKQMVRYSNHPTFGLGHSSVPDYEKPLYRMAKRLVDAGLPFDRRYQHPKGFFYSGPGIKMVDYFMHNNRMIDEFFRFYHAEFYKKHRRGNPPIRDIPNSEDEDSKGEKHVVENTIYGPAFWEVPWVHEDVRTQADQWQGAPLPAWIPRTKANIAKRFRKVVYYSGAFVALWILHDGRIIAVRETVAPQSLVDGAYSRDRRQNKDLRVKGYQRWPVGDVGELQALVRGSVKLMQVQAGPSKRHVWNRPGEEACPF